MRKIIFSLLIILLSTASLLAQEEQPSPEKTASRAFATIFLDLHNLNYFSAGVGYVYQRDVYELELNINAGITAAGISLSNNFNMLGFQFPRSLFRISIGPKIMILFSYYSSTSFLPFLSFPPFTTFKSLSRIYVPVMGEFRVDVYFKKLPLLNVYLFLAGGIDLVSSLSQASFSQTSFIFSGGTGVRLVLGRDPNN